MEIAGSVFFAGTSLAGNLHSCSDFGAAMLFLIACFHENLVIHSTRILQAGYVFTLRLPCDIPRASFELAREFIVCRFFQRTLIRECILDELQEIIN